MEREIEVYDIQRAVRLMWLVSGLSLAAAAGLLYLVWG
jgi:cobalamin biosynthesis protein CobD/CbiB